eukprot:scaffold7679_cov403-Prasinococcus_capsulatus_cf.AAC.3
MAPACSAAFPTIGRAMVDRNGIGRPNCIAAASMVSTSGTLSLAISMVNKANHTMDCGSVGSSGASGDDLAEAVVPVRAASSR